jgi:electron transfer flavoprotein-quinone oxidoreductase
VTVEVERIEMVVVGGGLAGLACAREAAAGGMGVLVIERGDHPGAKNVTGGRIYLEPIRSLLPEGFWEGAPLERRVGRETLTLACSSSSTSLTYEGEPLRSDGAGSFTVLRSRLDRWMAGRAEEAGATIVPQTVVTGLLRKDGRVAGVTAGDEEIEADVVVAADGALSFLGREVGLLPSFGPAGHALGIKEVVALDAGKIEDRFALPPGEGCARLFVGAVTGGMPGGAFLYTNRESVSAGVVVALEDLGGRPSGADGAHALLDAFKRRPEVKPLLEGGETVEYSAHVVPELPAESLPRRVADGLLLAGDAAGLVLNHGVTVRGMDLAIASGVLAARACTEAKRRGDYSATGLAAYDALLDGSFVGKDLARHTSTHSFLRRKRIYDHYPCAVCGIMEHVFGVGPDGKERLYPEAAARARKGFVSWEALKDLMAARKL